MSNIKCVIDPYALFGITDFLKRCRAMKFSSKNPQHLLGYKEQKDGYLVYNVCSFSSQALLNINGEHFPQDKKSLNKIGRFSSGPIDAELTGDGIFLQVILPDNSFDLTIKAIYYSTSPSPIYDEIPFVVAYSNEEQNVAFANIMGPLFPEVQERLDNEDPFSLDYAINDGQRNEFMKRADAQLKKLEKLANETTTQGKELDSLRKELHEQCQKMICEDGSNSFNETRVKDALVVKYLASIIRKKVNDFKSALEAKSH